MNFRAKTTASISLLGAVDQFIVDDGIHVVHSMVVVRLLVGLDIQARYSLCEISLAGVSSPRWR